MAVLTSAFSGNGTTLGYRSGTSGAFTTLAQLGDDLSGPNIQVAILEIKYLASGSVIKIPARTDSGEVSGTMYFVYGDATVVEMFTLLSSKLTYEWQIQFPDGSSSTSGTTIVFSAPVSNLEIANISGEDSPVCNFTLSVSGLTTIVVGS